MPTRWGGTRLAEEEEEDEHGSGGLLDGRAGRYLVRQAAVLLANIDYPPPPPEILTSAGGFIRTRMGLLMEPVARQ